MVLLVCLENYEKYTRITGKEKEIIGCLLLISWLDSGLHFVSIYTSALLLTVELFNIEGHVTVEWRVWVNVFKDVSSIFRI